MYKTIKTELENIKSSCFYKNEWIIGITSKEGVQINTTSQKEL